MDEIKDNREHYETLISKLSEYTDQDIGNMYDALVLPFCDIDIDFRVLTENTDLIDIRKHLSSENICCASLSKFIDIPTMHYRSIDIILGNIIVINIEMLEIIIKFLIIYIQDVISKTSPNRLRKGVNIRSDIETIHAKFSHSGSFEDYIEGLNAFKSIHAKEVNLAKKKLERGNDEKL